MRLTIDEIMTITTSMKFEEFCKDFGYDVWVVSEGGGHIEINMTILEAKKYGVINVD